MGNGLHAYVLDYLERGSLTSACMRAGSLEEAQALAGGEASVQLMDIDEPAAEGGSVDEEEGEDEAELEPGEHRPTARRRSVADLSEAGQRV